MQVLKFGGTSVANAANMSAVADIVCKALTTDRTIMVSSAVSKCTDTLIEIGHRAAARDEAYISLIDQLQDRHHTIIADLLKGEYGVRTAEAVDALFISLRSIAQGVFLLGELSPTSLAAIQSFGELFSTKILAARFAALGVSSKWIDSREIIKTDSEKGGAVDTALTYANIAAVVEKNPQVELFVVPGFIASDEKGRMTTLGRGGSDYSASLYAVAVKARIVEIWTDVSGMMTANPKVVETAKPIPHISYRAAFELSHFGAKVIYPPTIQPAVSAGLPICIKNTFEPDAPGTLIEQNPPQVGSQLIGISNSDNIALISLEGSAMVGVPGFSSRLFAALSENNVNIILITQASSVNTMCVAISQEDAPKAKVAADACFAYEISIGKINPLKVETGFSICCLVGDNVLGNSGATGRMLAALGRHGIPVRATAQGSSERNVSVIVPSEFVDNAMRHIHAEFFDRDERRIYNVFIAGYGTVGKAFVKILSEQKEAILARTGKEIRVCGISNSRKFVINTSDGIDLTRVDELLAQGKSTAEDAYFDALCELSLAHSRFVDCTANVDIAFMYKRLFKAGYSIVTANKVPLSGPYVQYEAIKSAAIASGRSFRHETTVGAALPIIETVSRAANSGDRFVKIEAVLSGTLSYLFNNYDGGDFDALVQKAHDLGYTEPNPALDLSGRDVLRKLLIVSREAGLPLEENDVQIEPVPSSEVIVKLFAQARERGEKLRYVASIDFTGEKPQASIQLRSVGPDSPLFALRGTDNCAVIQTTDYPSPLVVQGAGAGARQTAGGILNDLLM